MPTKKAKKKSTLDSHEPNIKAVLSLLVLLVAFGVFLLFNNIKDSLIGSPSLQFFLVLVVVLSGLLVGLMFLVNPQTRRK
jgi:hypothetical protein